MTDWEDATPCPWCGAQHPPEGCCECCAPERDHIHCWECGDRTPILFEVRRWWWDDRDPWEVTQVDLCWRCRAEKREAEGRGPWFRLWNRFQSRDEAQAAADKENNRCQSGRTSRSAPR